MKKSGNIASFKVGFSKFQDFEKFELLSMCLALVIMGVVGLYMYCKLRNFSEAFIFTDAKFHKNKPLRND